MVMIPGRGGYSPGHSSLSSYSNQSSKYRSSYGASKGYGMTDRQSQDWASKLRGRAYYDFTTFYAPIARTRRAKGFMQILGHTVDSLTYRSLMSGKGITRGVITGDTGLSAYEFASKFQEVGKTGTGERLFLPRVPGRMAPASSAMASQGITTQQGTPVSSNLFENLFRGYKGGVADPVGNRGAGGWLAMLRRGGGGLGIPPAEDTKGGIGGLNIGIALILLKVLS